MKNETMNELKWREGNKTGMMYLEASLVCLI